ncbi:hypothetical protein Bravens_01560 [Brevibacterium ravenspurgense]|uniref:Uncharacterized protein n=1 Tax=Brevibacterium ravenspurgense TaxID=479117 RepID=A0A150H906_9MICO|nr:hypothetical protein Bravens_01560 [Brevibacterium ravenspurgense]
MRKGTRVSSASCLFVTRVFSEDPCSFELS